MCHAFQVNNTHTNLPISVCMSEKFLIIVDAFCTTVSMWTSTTLFCRCCENMNVFIYVVNVASSMIHRLFDVTCMHLIFVRYHTLFLSSHFTLWAIVCVCRILNFCTIFFFIVYMKLCTIFFFTFLLLARGSSVFLNWIKADKRIRSVSIQSELKYNCWDFSNDIN